MCRFCHYELLSLHTSIYYRITLISLVSCFIDYLSELPGSNREEVKNAYYLTAGILMFLPPAIIASIFLWVKSLTKP